MNHAPDAGSIARIVDLQSNTLLWHHCATAAELVQGPLLNGQTFAKDHQFYIHLIFQYHQVIGPFLRTWFIVLIRDTLKAIVGAGRQGFNSRDNKDRYMPWIVVIRIKPNISIVDYCQSAANYWRKLTKQWQQNVPLKLQTCVTHCLCCNLISLLLRCS